MKKLTALFLLVFTISNAAEARSPMPVQNIAELGFNTFVEAGDTTHHGYARVSVDNYGQMTVSFDSARTQKVLIKVTENISPNNFYKLQHRIKMLSNVELNHEAWLAACLMMPPYGSERGVGLMVREGYDFQRPLHSTGEMREVLSGNGCWIGYSIYPAPEGIANSARELKFALELMAEQMLERQFKN